MKISKQYISVFFSLFLFVSAQRDILAQETLENSLEMAAKNNPGLKAAYNQYLAALEKVPQVGSLPDPQASFGFFIKPMELLGGNQIANIQLMQMFPWFGTLAASKDEASLMAKAKFEEFNAEKAELFFKVKSGWYQLMKFDREILLVDENIKMLESIENLALIKFQAPASGNSAPEMKGSGNPGNSEGAAMNSQGGEMNGMNRNTRNNNNMVTSGNMPGGMNSPAAGLQDVLRVRMEILEQENRRSLLTDQRLTEEALFNSLLNRPLDIQIQISDSLIATILPVNKDAIGDSILKNNPMLFMLENEKDSYVQMEEKAKKMGMPMLGVGLNYMLIGERTGNTAMMNGKDMIMPMISVSIPVYRRKYNAMKGEARMLQESGNQQIIEMRNTLLVRSRKLVQDLDNANRRIELYREQEKLARKTTGLLLAEFATTGKDYEEVLRMQLKVLEYGFNHVEAIVDYNTSVALSEMLINSTKL